MPIAAARLTGVADRAAPISRRPAACDTRATPSEAVAAGRGASGNVGPVIGPCCILTQRPVNSPTRLTIRDKMGIRPRRMGRGPARGLVTEGIGPKSGGLRTLSHCHV